MDKYFLSLLKSLTEWKGLASVSNNIICAFKWQVAMSMILADRSMALTGRSMALVKMIWYILVNDCHYVTKLPGDSTNFCKRTTKTFSQWTQVVIIGIVPSMQ